MRIDFVVSLVIVCMLAACDRPATRAPASIEPVALHFNVTGMMCEACEQAIADSVSAVAGVVDVKAVHATGEVDVRTTDPGQRDVIAAAIEKLNYKIAK